MLNAANRRIYEDLMAVVSSPHDYAIIIAKLYAELFNEGSQQLITVDDGVGYIFDGGRNKQISTSRLTLTAGESGAVNNRYLSMNNVPLAGNQGFLIPRKATLTALWAKSRSTGTWDIELRRNGVTLTVANVTVASGVGFNRNINIDLDEGDWVQFYVAGNSNQPVAVAEVAWRL